MKADLYVNEKPHIIHEILTYLAEHPDCNDTLEGIVEWWLLERKIEYAVAKVKEALSELVTKGLVLENKGRDSRTHYRINRRKHGEIQVILKGEVGYKNLQQ
ncbi:MAG: hypothetical protein ACFFCW_01460 [Candidatus Hodarchaeota archaeon]